MIFRRNTEGALGLDHVFEDGQTLREALEGPGVPHDDDHIFPPYSPGESLAHMLDHKNISVEKCAKRCKLPVETIEDVLAAYIPVDENIAKGLARGFKLPADIWLAKESSYQESLLHYGESARRRPMPARRPMTTRQMTPPQHPMATSRHPSAPRPPATIP